MSQSGLIIYNITGGFSFYRRDEFVLVIRYAYRKLIFKPLPVFGVKFKNLKEFTTTKKDRKRGVSRMPGESMLVDSLYDQQEQQLQLQLEPQSPMLPLQQPVKVPKTLASIN
jgi:hypothetical protein